jgi:hypothetical protein
LQPTLESKIIGGRDGSTEIPGHIALDDDDTVDLVLRPWRLIIFWKYLVTLGLYHFWWKRDVLALTDRRLIVTRGFVFSKTDQSLPLDRLQDINRHRVLFWSYLGFSTAGGILGSVRWGPYAPHASREFADAVAHQRTEPEEDDRLPRESSSL